MINIIGLNVNVLTYRNGRDAIYRTLDKSVSELISESVNQ